MLPHDDDSVDVDDIKNKPPEVMTDLKPHDLILVPKPTPCILFHALNGFLVPLTLKITGHIFGKEVVVLIDSASMYNFI